MRWLGGDAEGAVGRVDNGNRKPALRRVQLGRPYLDEIRRACHGNLRQDVPARIIALGVSPPRGGGDDDAWEELCQVFTSLDCAKEYWSKNEGERAKMAGYGFEGRDGYFDELLDALDREADRRV